MRKPKPPTTARLPCWIRKRSKNGVLSALPATSSFSLPLVHEAAWFADPIFAFIRGCHTADCGLPNNAFLGVSSPKNR